MLHRRMGSMACWIKAHRSAVGFFLALGLEQLPVENPDWDYPHRFRKI